MFRLKRVAICLAACAVGVLVYAFWRRDPSLELYTSPPIKSHGQTVRVQILMPEGWTASSPEFLDVVMSAQGVYVKDVIHLELTDPRAKRLSWMPGILRQLFLPKPEKDACLSIDVGTIGAHRDEVTRVERSLTSSPDGQDCSSERSLLVRPEACVYYRRFNPAEFDATYRPICESFRVLH